jgi:hypothetical protein
VEKAGASSICRYCRAPVIVPCEERHAAAASALSQGKRSAGPLTATSETHSPPESAEKSAERILISFLRDLQAVHDAEIDKDPDDLVQELAEILDRRQASIQVSRCRFLADLKAVFESEGSVDPESYIPLLSARLNEVRSQSIRRMEDYLSTIPEDDPLRCPISLFGTLGLGRLETAHTNALAWLLHPRKDHGLGIHLLDALLSHLIKTDDYTQVQVTELLPEYRIVFGNEYLGRLDVFGTGTWVASNGASTNWLLAIEAKIDASEGDKQLENYDKWLDAYCADQQVFRVFLTPEGRHPEAEVSGWHPLSFLDLVRVFRKPFEVLRDRTGFYFLRYYLTGILKDICRWRIPWGSAESCEDPYGFVDYLQTVRATSQGECRHANCG